MRINITNNIGILEIAYAQSVVGQMIWIFRSAMICGQINDIRIATHFLVKLLDELTQLTVQLQVHIVYLTRSHAEGMAGIVGGGEADS